MIINLDHNSTTAVHPEVAQVMAECYLAGYGNAASSHQHGRRARQVLEDAREGIGRLLGADLTGVQADRIILTSGGTEANNLALFGMAGTKPGRVIISSVEHPSVTGPAEQLERRGFDVCRVRVDSSGVVDEAHFEELLTPATRMVSIMLANNETGVLQPIESLAGRCRALGVPFHTDAVQAVGKIPVHFAQLQVTALTLTAHKFHGPRGIGALLIQRPAHLEPMVFGGFQQMALRPGTEPLELAVGLHHALQVWQRDAPTRAARMSALRDRFEQLLARLRPGRGGQRIGCAAVAAHVERGVSRTQLPGGAHGARHGRRGLFDRLGLRQRVHRTLRRAAGHAPACQHCRQLITLQSGCIHDAPGY